MAAVSDLVIAAAPELQDMADESEMAESEMVDTLGIEAGSSTMTETLTQELTEAQSMFGMLGSGNMQA